MSISLKHLGTKKIFPGSNHKRPHTKDIADLPTFASEPKLSKGAKKLADKKKARQIDNRAIT